MTVLGDRYDIPSICSRRAVDLVALAIPSPGGAVIREVVGICQSARIPVRTVPGLRDLVRNTAAPTDLREVTVEDLLGREQVEIDAEMCAATIRGKSVMITGAAGFIASELARQVFAFGPSTLHLVDVNETGLYDLERDLEVDDDGSKVRIWLCDIADAAQVDTVFSLARPDVVFHAAAYKHIPVMEDHPDAAMRVNVTGTLNVCASANEAGVSKVVFVSTDKAVNPDNVYGATKRIGELLVTAIGQDSPTTYAAVRFGNVMGSRGSVVPLFLRQIERGGPVLLTDPETTRFQMAVEEAASLVIQAASFAAQGQIFILDMGEPIKTADLAEKMIRLKGMEPGRDIQIVYTGLRAGEKLHEELVGSSEKLLSTHHKKIPSCRAGRRSRATSWWRRCGSLRTCRRATARRSRRACRRWRASTCATPAKALQTARDGPSAMDRQRVADSRQQTTHNEPSSRPSPVVSCPLSGAPCAC